MLLVLCDALINCWALILLNLYIYRLYIQPLLPLAILPIKISMINAIKAHPNPTAKTKKPALKSRNFKRMDSFSLFFLLIEQGFLVCLALRSALSINPAWCISKSLKKMQSSWMYSNKWFDKSYAFRYCLSKIWVRGLFFLKAIPCRRLQNVLSAKVKRHSPYVA